MRILLAALIIVACLTVPHVTHSSIADPTPTPTYDILYPATRIPLPPLPPTVLPPHGSHAPDQAIYLPLVNRTAVDAVTARRPID